MYNGEFRHICGRHNTIKQLISTGGISIDCVKLNDNIADMLNKWLNQELVKSSRKIRVKSLNE